MAETYNDINLKSLVFNKVTNEEYRQMVQNGTIKDDEFYITPSELIDVPNIDSTTSGKYLTNDGIGALWSDVQSTNVVQDLSNPSADTVPSTKAVADESSRITSIMNTKQDKSTAVNYNNISNCITEIPQDIKLELNDGTLTLKAGSKVYVPNGAGVFNVITTTSNLYIGPTSGSGKVLVSINSTETFGSVCPINKCVSGAGVTPIDYSLVYDTTTNIITRYGANGSIIYSNSSFPLAVCSQTDGKLTSIDQVFNGFGYIGSTIFALPGVKGRIPNSRNADGSLKSIEFTTRLNTYTATNTSNTSNRYICLNINGYLQVPQQLLYNSEENKNIYNGNEVSWCAAGTFSIDSTGKITSFTPKTVFHASDYNESSRLESIMNNKVSKSGDTMTGQLVVKDANIILSSTKDVVNAIVKTDEDDTQTPTKNHIDGFRVLDKNNKIMSDFRSQRNSTSTLTQMIARKNNADGTTKQADISCSVDSNGNAISTLNQTTYVNGAVVSNLDNINFIARSKSLVKGTTPTDSNKYVGYDWQDKNGQRLAYFGVAYGTNGTKRLELQKLDNNLSEFNIPFVVNFQDNEVHFTNLPYKPQKDFYGVHYKIIGTNAAINFRGSSTTTGHIIAQMMLTDKSQTKETYHSISIDRDIDNQITTTHCPKPADNSNSDAIATTNWAGGLKRPNTWLASNTFKGAIELSPANNPNHGGYIDFHYNGNTGDYTSRIIENTKGTIEFASNTSTQGTAYFMSNPRVIVGNDNRLISKSANLIKGTAPTAIQYGGISFRDKNDVEMAGINSLVNKDNTATSNLWVKQPTTSGNASANISVSCDKNGNFYTYAPQCKVANSILTTVSHGQGYAKLGNGIIIQSGIFTASASTKTGQVTLPLAMTTSNYRVLFTQNTAGNASYKGTAEIRTTTHGTTYFKWAAVNCSSDFNMFIDWFLIVLPS